MKNSSKNNTKDELLNRYEAAYEESQSLKDRARILKRMSVYIKKRYNNSVEFHPLLFERVQSLESELLSVFDFVSNVVADVRRGVKNTGRRYGAALNEKPTGDDLKEVRSFEGPKGITRADDIDIDPDMPDPGENAEKDGVTDATFQEGEEDTEEHAE